MPGKPAKHSYGWNTYAFAWQVCLFVMPGVIVGINHRLGLPPESGHVGGVNYATLASVAEVSASKTSGATRLHQECRLRVL